MPGDVTTNPPSIPQVLAQISPLIQQLLFGLAPVLLVVALVYAGYIRLTAAENSKKVIQSNMIIMFAIVGYAVVLLSFFIIRFAASLLGYDGVGSSINIGL